MKLLKEILAVLILCRGSCGQNETPINPDQTAVEQNYIDQEFQKEVNTVKSQIDWLVNSINKLQTNYGNLQTDYKDVQSKLKVATDQIQALEQNVSSAQSILQNYAAKYADMRNDNYNLQKIIAILNTTLYDHFTIETNHINNVSRDLGILSTKTNKAIGLLQQRDTALEQILNANGNDQTAVGSSVQNTKVSGSSADSNGSKVVFLVQMSNDRYFSSHNMVRFDKTTVNDGLGFDTASGVFIAPVSGIYFFTVLLESRNGDLEGRLVKNDVQIGYYYGYNDGRNPAVASTSTYVHLTVGDRVWLEWFGASNTAIRGSFYSHFGGHLVVREE